MPDAFASLNPTGSQTYLRSDHVQALFRKIGPERLTFEINATDLAAGTPKNLVSPIDGYIKRVVLAVQEAIVTGGAVTVKIGTTDVTGMSVTVANSATVGTTINDEVSLDEPSAHVAEGQRIQIIPAAAFNGGGALTGFVEIWPS